MKDLIILCTCGDTLKENIDYDHVINHLEKKLPDVTVRKVKHLCLADDKKRIIDRDGKLIDENGRFINEKGRFVDDKGRLVDKDGNFIIIRKPFIDDRTGQPLKSKKKRKK